MSRSAVARHYAEAVFEMASREGEPERYGEHLDAVVLLYREEEAFRAFLETPRIRLEEKKEVLEEVLGPRVPALFLRFLHVVLENRRQRALPEIAEAYRDLLDEQAGRAHASVSLPFAADEALEREVVKGLERSLGKRLMPRFRRELELIGGVRIRVGDLVMDGSLRRRLEDLRAELVEAVSHGDES